MTRIQSDWTVRIKKYEPKDPRLGRHVRHDSRSRMFAYPRADRASLVSVKHTSEIPVLDQGNLGSCTGNASTKALSYDLLWTDPVKAVLSTTDANADEKYAVGVYSDGTAIDPWEGSYPPDDTGCDGLSVAKVLLGRGLISGYQHAFDLDSLLNALQTRPVIVGSVWLEDMFDPDSNGQLHVSGTEQGGHEYCLDEIDVENERVWIQNSWGTSWGIDGRAWFSWADMEKLLANDGDCVSFVPVTQPAPTPTPVPVPTPADPDRTLCQALASWLLTKKRVAKNEAARQALLKWKHSKNL